MTAAMLAAWALLIRKFVGALARQCSQLRHGEQRLNRKTNEPRGTKTRAA
jgi:hypothetical protein